MEKNDDDERRRESTGVSKEESRIIEGDDGTGLPVDVVLIFEEFDEGVSDALGRPFDIE